MIRHLLLLCLSVTLTACATLTGDLDPPQITIENVESLPDSGSTPRFLITLRIANPNKQALDIVGVSYSMELLGKELMEGVSNEIPRIEPYGEGEVKVVASLKLFQLLRLFASLGQEPTESIEYKVSAKIDFAGLIPTQRVEETGGIDFSGAAR